MNSDRRLSWFAVGLAVFVCFAVLGAFAWAASNSIRREPGPYSGYNEKAPWFDGLPWDWFLDMFNQQSLKPQEVGSFQNFPLQSVPRSGVEPFIGPVEMAGNLLRRDAEPANPVATSPESVTRGRFVFDTYCAVCHARDGMGNTPVVQRGMPAPPIAMLLPVLSESHLYNKARYGGPLMPSYGFQTTQQERWDLVNYMKSAEFGKEAKPQ